MNMFKKLAIPLMIAVAALGAALLLLPFEASAGNRVDNSNLPAQRDELAIGAQTAITVIGEYGEANLSQHLTGGFSDPQIVASSDYVAAVYRGVNGSVYLQATKNISGWYGTPVTLGQGSVPDLAISGTNVVHAVWLKTGNEVVEYKKCTLGPTTASCDDTATVLRSDTNEILNNPVIAVDGSGRLHVAWTVPANDKVESRVHNGSSWGTTASVPGSPDAPEQAAIAATTGNIILAFINNVSGGQNAVSVYRSPVGDNPHVWTNRANYRALDAGGGAYDKVNDIGLAAGGIGAYLAWSIRDTDADADIFKLVGVVGTNSGDDWLSGGGPKYITSANTYGTSSDIDKRRSKDSSTPVQEIGLRPSVAITPTNNFVVVWQERPDDVCQDANPGEGEPELNGTSAIFFADKSSTNWTTQLGQLDNDRTTYSIDPDIVVQGSTRHIIYMKYTGGNPADCAGGGGASQYNIYYRGPYITVQAPSGGIFLPIILKTF